MDEQVTSLKAEYKEFSRKVMTKFHRGIIKINPQWYHWYQPC